MVCTLYWDTKKIWGIEFNFGKSSKLENRKSFAAKSRYNEKERIIIFVLTIINSACFPIF